MFRITILSFILLAVAFRLSAQTASYDQLWKKIEALDGKQGLTKSALEIVEQVYRKAKGEKNEAQLIKALVRKVELQALISDSDVPSITLLKKEIAEKIAAELKQAGVEMILTEHSVQAAEHAAASGLIFKEEIPAIVQDKKEDKGQAPGKVEPEMA